jgi:hypothetical protein
MRTTNKEIPRLRKELAAVIAEMNKGMQKAKMYQSAGQISLFVDEVLKLQAVRNKGDAISKNLLDLLSHEE